MDGLLKKGFVISDLYEIQFPIGSGPFCQSYRVKDNTGKILRLDLFNLASLPSQSFASDGELYQVKLCKQVQHSNIPKLLGNGELVLNKQKIAYLAFEFVSGESLEEHLKREGSMSPYAAVPIIIELLQTLGYLHDLEDPVIHNNIQPQTVVLDYSENRKKPILRSFEFARTLSQTSKSFYNEKLSYFHTAPELFNGIFVPQSDLFATGALLYHLIMGMPPWFDQKVSSQKVFEKIKERIEIARTKPLNFKLTDEFLIDDHQKNTIKKALSPDVQDRFLSADDFIKTLNRKVLLEDEIEYKAFSNNKMEPQKLTNKKGLGFDAVAGMAELKGILYNDVIRALNEKELYESYGITIPNGMLLYGPPGCGKTFIAEKFSEEIGFNFVSVIPSDLASIYVHGTQDKIGKLFQDAKKNAPTIIFIDEIDALSPSREGDLQHSYASEVNELLAQMTNCAEHGIFIIAATNRPEKIDAALLRTGRIDRIVYLPPPDKQAREAMFKLYLKERPVDLGVDYERLAELTESYVSSDLKFLIDEASRISLQNDSRITMKILEDVITINRPSVTLNEIKKYEALNAKWENTDQNTPHENERKPIGFFSNKLKE